MILHPIWRYAGILTMVLAAALALAVTASINPHSTLWLLAVCASGGLATLLAKRPHWNPRDLAFAGYLFALWQYLMAVWILHVCVPVGPPGEAQSSAEFWMIFFWPGCIFMGPALLHFSLRFSERTSTAWNMLNAASWIVSVAFFGVYLAGELFDGYFWTGVTWVPRMGRAYPYFAGLTAALVSLSLAAPLAAWRDPAQRARRGQFVYYMAGAAPLWAACLSHFLLSMGIALYPTGGFFFLWHILLIAYATVRHRVFEIAIRMRRAFAYAFVSMLLGLLYGAILWLSAKLSLPALDAVDPWMAALFIAGAGFLLSPLAGYAQTAIDRFFFREAARRERRLETFAKEVSASIELPDVADALGRLLQETLAPRDIRLLLLDTAGRERLYASHAGRTEIVPGWPDAIGRESGFEAEPAAEADEAPLRLTACEDECHMPLVHRDRRIGSIRLGPRLADEPYTAGDLRWIESVAAHASVALANALAYADLARLQRLNETMLKDLAAGVLLLDPGGATVQSNPAARQLLGPGASLDALPPLRNAVQAALAEHRPLTDFALSDGGNPERTWLLSLRYLDEFASRQLALLSIHEISEFKRLEAQLSQTQELARVGEFVAVINHEIHNAVQPVRSMLAQLQQTNGDRAGLERILLRAPERLQVLDRLANGIRQYFRPICLRPRALNPLELLESVFRDLGDYADSLGVTLNLDRTEGEAGCTGDPEWLRLALHNLVKNAIEAAALADTRYVTAGAIRERGMRGVTIRDSGPGMDERVQARLFEPFFSTKGEPGTGLGLSLSKKVVDLHHGCIEVTSAPGAGSTFAVLLPDPREAPAATETVQAQPTASPRP